MEFIATCPKGFEPLLAGELSSLQIGGVRPLRGQVSFSGELRDAYRVCLWSRLASNVTLVLSRIGAKDADELYEGLSAISWEDHVPSGATIAVRAHGTNAKLRNSQFLALHSKDAIVDRLHARRGARPMVDPSSPDVGVVVRLSREKALVGIDLSGEPLFRRGYESGTRARGEGRLSARRPDYAAAMLDAGGWYRYVRHGSPVLVDTFCGTGSVAVEAAGVALDRAPGLLRTRWGFSKWAQNDPKTWDELVKEASERARASAEKDFQLVISDTRRGAVEATRKALRASGLGLEPQEIAPAKLPELVGELADALVVADVAWPDEDAPAEEARALSVLSAVSEKVATKAGSTIVTLGPGDVTDAATGGVPEQTIDVLLGRDQASIRAYATEKLLSGHSSVTVGGKELPVLVPASDQFAARLAKVAKARAKWAASEDVSCYRVYDADLPDYAVSIDLYVGSLTRGRWLSISEYAPPKGIDRDLAHRRLLDVLTIAPQVMGVDPANVSLRVRRRAKGGSQYAEEGKRQAKGNGWRRRGHVELPAGAHLVDEGGLTFEVNFSQRLDCGIFLDHRDTRAMIREMMKQTPGGSFLNLFAYTGTATCYAADGGAGHTTTVDLSRPSLEWARRNMERNGFDGDEHEFVQADILRWVSEQRHGKRRWDLVFCDAPTFSNSSSMRAKGWDVQRDHAELIIDISRLLTRAGQAIFSCNLRTFKPDLETLSRAGVELEDITAKTIPEDFARNPRIHHCYIVTRK